MKKIYLIVILTLTSLFSFAQTQDEVISMLTQKAASMKEFKCVFVQEKTSYLLAKPAVSEGGFTQSPIISGYMSTIMSSEKSPMKAKRFSTLKTTGCTTE